MSEARRKVVGFGAAAAMGAALAILSNALAWSGRTTFVAGMIGAALLGLLAVPWMLWPRD